MATVKDMLMCPKCNKRMMGRSHPQKFGMEYFAHCCHQYFGVNELIHFWGFDAGDLFGDKSSFYIGEMEQLVPVHSEIKKVWFCEYPDGEPYWYSISERDDAYSMVNRMLLGIPEYDDYLDLKETEYDALGIGVQ